MFLNLIHISLILIVNYVVTFHLRSEIFIIVKTIIDEIYPIEKMDEKKNNSVNINFLSTLRGCINLNHKLLAVSI